MDGRGIDVGKKSWGKLKCFKWLPLFTAS